MEAELSDNPVFTVSDGLIWLYQSTSQNSIVRRMQIMKLRGEESATVCIPSALPTPGCKPSRARSGWPRTQAT